MAEQLFGRVIADRITVVIRFGGMESEFRRQNSLTVEQQVNKFLRRMILATESAEWWATQPIVITVSPDKSTRGSHWIKVTPEA